tara:strand:- start:179 stop:370 length:192 start_codon:yes stop_codon:yes gene_type:complete
MKYFIGLATILLFVGATLGLSISKENSVDTKEEKQFERVIQKMENVEHITFPAMHFTSSINKK